VPAGPQHWSDGRGYDARPASGVVPHYKSARSIRSASQGPARAAMGSLRERWWCVDTINAPEILLLDGLSAAIRFQLSSLAAGPDGMEAGVVVAGCTIPPDGLPIVHPYPVAKLRARSGRDGVGVVCLCLGGSGRSPWAAMMPVLRESVGGQGPQFPVTESTRFHRRVFRQMLAALAEGEEERKDDDIGPPVGSRWSA
jgi:hypothetical protein